MLDTNYIYLKQYINEKIPDVNLTRYATSVALGVSLGKMLAISTTPLHDNLGHFNNALVHHAATIASQFNENILVDIDLATSVTRSVWLVRQFCASSSGVDFIAAKGDGSFFDKFFGSAIYMDPKVSVFLDRNSEVMITIINRMSAQVKELMDKIFV